MKSAPLSLLLVFSLGLTTAGAGTMSREDESLHFLVNGKSYRLATGYQRGQTHLFLKGAERRNLSAEMGGTNRLPRVAVRDNTFLVSWIHFHNRRKDLAYYDSREKRSRLAGLSGFHFLSRPEVIFDAQASPLFVFKGNNSDNDELFLLKPAAGTPINLTGTPDHEKVFTVRQENDILWIETETLYHRYHYRVNMDNLTSRLLEKKAIIRDIEMDPPPWDAVSLNSIIAFGDSITCGEMTMDDLDGELHPELAYLAKVQEKLEEYGQTYTINLGESATNTYHAVERMNEDFAPNPAYYCLILYGTNDVGGMSFSAASTAENLEWICLNARNKFGMIPIISTIPPAKFWEPGVQVFKEETEALNALIKELAARNSIACIDTYTAFFQSSEGWEACLDDGKGLHPSPLGHDIMADLFKPKILEAIPFEPKNISLVFSDPNRVTVSWSENIEFDFGHYGIEFGYAPDSLSRVTRSGSGYFSFLNFPHDASVYAGVYFRIQSVDQDGNASAFSPVLYFDFQ